MTEYDYDAEPAEAPSPPEDERVTAMREMVERERYLEKAQNAADRQAKEAAIARDELSAARDRLHGLLGLPSSNAKAISREQYVNITQATR
jgi:hypothetical protein